MTPEITEDKVKEILRLFSFGLTKGLGEPVEGKMCIEHVISLVIDGKANSDNSSCVHPKVVKPKIALNDCDWSSNKARAKGMAAIGLAQLGSISLNGNKFEQLLKLNSIKRILPYLIQFHYDSLGEKDHKLLEYKNKFEALIELDSTLWKEFYYNYNNNYNNNYYNYYNCYYNYNNYHNYYNYYHYYCGNYCDIKENKFLLLIADVILQTLKEMNSEGCKWLYLLEKTEL